MAVLKTQANEMELVKEAAARIARRTNLTFAVIEADEFVEEESGPNSEKVVEEDRLMTFG